MVIAKTSHAAERAEITEVELADRLQPMRRRRPVKQILRHYLTHGTVDARACPRATTSDRRAV